MNKFKKERSDRKREEKMFEIVEDVEKYKKLMNMWEEL